MTQNRAKAESPFVLHTRCVTGVGGGPEKTILSSPRRLKDYGYQSACAYLHPPGDPGFEELVRKANVRQARIISIPDRGPADWRPVRELFRICRRENTAIWHGHDYKTNLLGLVVRKLWPMKLVTTVHGWVSKTFRTPLYHRIDKLILKYYDEVICVSEDLRAICLDQGVRADRCHLIRNGIDTEEFCRVSSSQQAKRDLGAPEHSILIGGVGRLMDEKGFDLLIEAVKLLVDEGLNLHLWIAGEGPDRNSLQRLASELSLDLRVRFLGNQPDPRPFFTAMDVFVLSSRREGLPNVLLEAMAMEVPVIATAVAGVPLLVTDGETGLLVAAESPSALAAAISRLVRSNDLRQRLAVKARKTVEERFSFQDRMRQVVEIYDRVLD